MMTVKIRKNLTVVVASYTEASKAVCDEIRRTDLGSAAWYRRRAGQIFVDGVQVAFVSYNGRVWKGVEDFKPGHEEIQLEGAS